MLSIARRTCADSVRRTVRRRLLSEQMVFQLGTEQQPASGEVDLWLLLAELDEDRRHAFVLTQVIGM